MARPEGFEPPISGIGIRCVIQLRHGRIFVLYLFSFPNAIIKINEFYLSFQMYTSI